MLGLEHLLCPADFGHALHADSLACSCLTVECSADVCSTLPDWPVCRLFGKYLLLGEGKVLGLLLGCRRSHVHPVRGPSALPSTLLGEGSGWLPLSGLPWIPASLAGFMHGST